jgi:hypothetical protein
MMTNSLLGKQTQFLVMESEPWRFWRSRKNIAQLGECYRLYGFTRTNAIVILAFSFQPAQQLWIGKFLAIGSLEEWDEKGENPEAHVGERSICVRSLASSTSYIHIYKGKKTAWFRPSLDWIDRGKYGSVREAEVNATLHRNGVLRIL